MEQTSSFNVRQTGLAQDDDWRVRKAVAENEYTESVLVGNLLADEDSRVRCAAAKHTNLPDDALLSATEKLEDVGVLRLIASRQEEMPREAFSALVKSDDKETLLALARNENTPDGVLEVLTEHKDFQIRKVIAER